MSDKNNTILGTFMRVFDIFAYFNEIFDFYHFIFFDKK
jgi:hypothetical protein